MPGGAEVTSGRRRAALVAALFLSAACATGPIPVFDTPHTVGGPLLLLEPSVSLLGGEPGEGARVGRRLAAQLRERLAEHAVRLADAPADRTATVRRAMAAALGRVRAERRGPLRPGERALAPRDLPAEVPEGGIALARLVRPVPPPGGGRAAVPPADELFLRPEDRPDYRIPKAGGEWVGIELELLIVDRSGRVTLHRRIAHPARSEEEILQALPVLVREILRGVRGA